jgi:hypothetical protein
VRLTLVRIALLATSLLALALAAVPAASAAEVAKESQRQLSIQMRVGGFKIEIDGEEESGTQEVAMYLTRRDQFAQYVVPAEITDSTLKAKFGSLGELDYSYAPKGATATECFGQQGSEAAFTGSFTFTGENGFVHIDAPAATGFYTLEPGPPTCATPRADPAAPAARAVPFQPYVGDGAALSAQTLAKTVGGVRQLLALTASRQKNAKEANFYAALLQDDHGMAVLRGVQMSAPARAFEWDFAAGTATVSPPAPFAGTATFKRLADGRKLFTGSLRVPILGIGTLRMAGKGFHSTLHRGVPNDP